MRNGALHSPIQDLRKDLHNVARDAEELLKATADVTGERVQEVRARTEKTVRQAFDHLYDARLRRRVRRAAHQTDRVCSRASLDRHRRSRRHRPADRTVDPPSIDRASHATEYQEPT